MATTQLTAQNSSLSRRAKRLRFNFGIFLAVISTMAAKILFDALTIRKQLDSVSKLCSQIKCSPEQRSDLVLLFSKNKRLVYELLDYIPILEQVVPEQRVVLGMMRSSLWLIFFIGVLDLATIDYIRRHRRGLKASKSSKNSIKILDREVPTMRPNDRRPCLPSTEKAFKAKILTKSSIEASKAMKSTRSSSRNIFILNGRNQDEDRKHLGRIMQNAKELHQKRNRESQEKQLTAMSPERSTTICCGQAVKHTAQNIMGRNRLGLEAASVHPRSVHVAGNNFSVADKSEYTALRTEPESSHHVTTARLAHCDGPTITAGSHNLQSGNEKADGGQGLRLDSSEKDWVLCG